MVYPWLLNLFSVWMLYYCTILEENNFYMNIFYYKFCNPNIGGINITLIHDYVF